MPSDIAISVRNLTKTFRIFGHPGDRIKQALTLGRVRFHREFTALKDISFDVKKGETIGIIGRNGSGKSTLLQLICGILKPTSGTVTVNGRVSALLELGAGFNPEFTGHENVYFQGALMGFTKAQMDERFDDIAAFADIGEFIDQPVRTYSSGMFVRLAFAVAASVEPDILVVDEALSVGDISFQQKCLERIQKMQEAGITIFLVSHDIMLMRSFGDTLIYLEKGRIKVFGEPERVGETYIRDTTSFAEHAAVGQPLGETEKATPNSIIAVKVSKMAEAVHIRVAVRLAADIANPEIVVQLRDPRGYILYGRHARGNDIVRVSASNGVDAFATLELSANLLAGNYGISVSLNSLDAHGTSTALDKRVGIAALQVMSADSGFHGCVNLGGRWLNNVQARGELEGFA